MRQWCHLARLDLSGPCAPSPLAVSALKAARLVTDPAIRRSYGNARRPEQPPDAIQSVLCIYCRTDKFVYWPSACRLPSADCPGCQRRIAEPAATLLAGTLRNPSRVTARAPERPASPGPGRAVLTSDVMSEAGRRPPSARLRGYLGSEKSGLLARFTTRLLPIIRRSGPRRHIDQPSRDVPSWSPAVQSTKSDPVPARQCPAVSRPPRNDHMRLSWQVTASEPAAAPEMSHREAAGR
jgi:hypothetical protein